MEELKMSRQKVIRVFNAALLVFSTANLTPISFARAQNQPPVISQDFPDTVITNQGVSVKDSIFALPLADFGFDPDGDSLIWSTSTEDSVVRFSAPIKKRCLYMDKMTGLEEESLLFDWKMHLDNLMRKRLESCVLKEMVRY